LEFRRLARVEVGDWSGFPLNIEGRVPPLRQGYYVVEADAFPGGDAPKDFIRAYEYGVGRRSSPASWPSYIAKVGHKRYPSESITEHLMTRIGQCMGVRMAESKLVNASGQLRFMSRYFLEQDQSLVHGAEIFAGYLADPDFVQEVNKDRRVPDVFTFRDVWDAVTTLFPDESDELLGDFFRMLGFDAIVGNHDRHIYNWGVVTDVKGRRPTRFSPIFDTARGLFWNNRESDLWKYFAPTKLRRYVDFASPQLGCPARAGANHFQFLAVLLSDCPEYASSLQDLVASDVVGDVHALMQDEFSALISEQRRNLIGLCLAQRVEKFREVVS
jgi:hypothetical protein